MYFTFGLLLIACSDWIPPGPITVVCIDEATISTGLIWSAVRERVVLEGVENWRVKRGRPAHDRGLSVFGLLSWR